MAEPIRAVPPVSFSFPRFMRRREEENEFSRWLSDTGAFANDTYPPPMLSLEDEILLGRLRNSRPLTRPANPYADFTSPEAVDEDGQYAFDFMRIPPPRAGVRMNRII